MLSGWFSLMISCLFLAMWTVHLHVNSLGSTLTQLSGQRPHKTLCANTDKNAAKNISRVTLRKMPSMTTEKADYYLSFCKLCFSIYLFFFLIICCSFMDDHGFIHIYTYDHISVIPRDVTTLFILMYMLSFANCAECAFTFGFVYDY